ncbi:MAG: aldehyde ferredoxin oxidoreductase [Anaerolineales bacterium]|nr:aldehyde ferredoxin oxidoreductase [Anaerolineae bacterium]PWB52971.1 MAG: aldehyde ferredoxin oxidoreductase [Anaerolineales bacterium]
MVEKSTNFSTQKVWRINSRTRQIACEPVPEAWEKLGGRALIAKILVDEVKATCEPLGPLNKLIFTPGLLVGHMLSSCDRISVGGKSPLTGGVKEANAGGTTGLQMALLGIKAILIEDKPDNNEWSILFVDHEGIRFEPADNLVGCGVYDCGQKIVAWYGGKVAAAIIGPGGEMQLAASGIQNFDKENIPSRIAARGGLGAVMGSKKIKAVVIDARQGQKPPLIDPDAYKQAQKVFTQTLMGTPQTAVYRDYGTAAMARMAQGFGGIPTRNFSEGTFEDVETISGEYMRDLILSRGGRGVPTHACMPGCTIRCSNNFADEHGETIVAPLEYETIGLMGSNLGISNLDEIARLNWMVNDLGLDSIEIGAALGVAAKAGLMNFGDVEQAHRLLDEIKLNTPLGRLLGSGATITGKVLGVEQVPAVKGQAMSSYEPRAIKGTGVTYATSPQGADHTSGLTIRAKVDHLDPAIQADLSRPMQINMAGYDSLGACIFTGSGFTAAPDSIRDLINARYGWNVGSDFLQVLGRESLKWEHEFNRLAGFTSADDRLPEWMTREPLPPNNSVFDVSDEDLDGVYNW